MIIEDGKFYFIKDDFFEIFKEYNLMENKESGTKDHVIFVLEINIIKKLFGLFLFLLNMKNIKKYLNIKNKNNIEYIILFLEK